MWDNGLDGYGVDEFDMLIYIDREACGDAHVFLYEPY